jgi:nicotinate phosphoribosyltransferase
MPNRARSTASALLTDLYQLTMAYAYWKSGRADLESVFHLFFRKHPFHGGFTLAAGLEDALAYIRDFRFAPEDLEYLASLRGGDQLPLFEPGFLEYLQALKLRVDVDAVTEGTVVFPHEPLLRVRGGILQCQLLETALLNLINFQTLVATKAARICLAARGDPVIEFGLRRAQGPDGALSAARAAYLGGCEATSNVLAGQVLGLPVLGTHAHSWVMCFSDELEAFETYARAMPNNCVFLVDTYDSLEGVRHAVRAGERLRERGHELAGIRLDSGDLAYLSIQARKILDEGGFPQARIVASNDLDEHIIASLKEQGATVNVWGVGTKLVTAYDDPALGGVYKLSAVRAVSGRWEHKLKLSEQAVKITTPGILQVRRYRVGDEYREDMIYDLADGIREPAVIVDPLDPTRRKTVPAGTPHEDLLVPVVREGRCVYVSPALPEIRARAQAQLGLFHAGVKRFVNPHQFPVGLELGLHELKTRLILEARGKAR